MFTVEVIYATLHEQDICTVECEKGDTINDVIVDSGLLQKYSDIDLSVNKVGVFNQLKKLHDEVHEGDRVEIYRPLIANPKEVRRKRVLEQKQQGVINKSIY